MRRGFPDVLTNALLAIFAVAVLIGAIYAVKSGGPGTSSVSTVVSTTTTPKPKIEALFIGDSYTAGEGAPSADAGESCLTASALAWTCGLDAEGGTGFLANGHSNQPGFQPVPARLAKDVVSYPSPNVVVIDAGRNDATKPVGDVEAAERTFLADLHKAYPKAKLVLVLPYYMTNDTPPLGAGYTDFLTQQASQYHAVLVNPFKEGWVSKALTGGLTVADKVHPNAAGHAWISRHLVIDFKAAGLNAL